MRVLEVLPTYPGDQFDGSAVYERRLNRALIERGVEVEVLTTRAKKLRHERQFSLRWPDELPARDEHDGVSIRRFRALDTRGLGGFASEVVERRWSREDFVEGAVVSVPDRVSAIGVDQARRRPKHVDMLADIGRGPLVPGLLAYLTGHARAFDVILVGYAPFSISRQVLWAARPLRVPVVLLPFIHDSDRYHLFDSLLDTYERAAAVLTLSEHTSDFLRRHTPGARPVTLGAGVTTIGAGQLSPETFRARYGLDDRPLVLYVGRKEKSKRYELVVDAVESLSGDAQLMMVGRDVDGEPIESDDVRYLGTLSDEELAAAYDCCDVFVLPSEFESFGMVFLDAWLHGKPVIGNLACGAAASLIDDGVDGLLCRDAADIAAGLRRLIGDPALASSMGRAGQAKTLENYTWDRVAERALEALHDVTGSRA